MGSCPFCDRLATGHAVAANAAAAAFPDAFPVAEGHILVVPRRHVEDLFTLAEEEWLGVWVLVRAVRSQVREKADGWNVGVNVGTAGGQTIGHAHVHVIPRRDGDVPDPRGGVRWVLPVRADYWTKR